MHNVGGASALPWGMLHPQFALDDPPLVRLTRAGVAAAQAVLERAVPDGDFDGELVARNTGVLQLAGDPNEAERWRQAVQRIDVPSFVRWCTETVAAEHIGMRPRGAGVWWPAGTIVAPARWCRAVLARHSIRPEHADVGRVVADGALWKVLDRNGAVIAAAPIVVVAAAMASASLLGMADARLRPVRGRTALLHGDAWAALRAPVTGDGYLLRDPDGGASVGATYEDVTPVGALSDERALKSNLARIPRLLASPPVATVVGTFDGVRCVAHDRLPHAGAVADEAPMQAAAAQLRGAHLADLPRRSGLMACFALGSRGLTLAPLLAELIAARIEGEPMPVERDLAAAVDPARFALRALRRSRDLAAAVQPATSVAS
jgi:tRNA 5-methylaminomethyl-2-thiouridine biosynthesis bifunctional protein